MYVKGALGQWFDKNAVKWYNTDSVHPCTRMDSKIWPRDYDAELLPVTYESHGLADRKLSGLAV